MKKWILGLILGIGTFGCLRSLYERSQFEIEETIISSPKIKKKCSMIFLSDIHDKTFGKHNYDFVSAIENEKPDYILIGGDTMVAKKGHLNLTYTEQLIKALSKIAPIYYGNGNHELRLMQESKTYGKAYHEFLKILKKYNVHYLSNSKVQLEEGIEVSGIDIGKPYYKDFIPKKMKVSYIKRKLGNATSNKFQILLAHSPLFQDTYGKWGADLTLSGHFHGGTIRLPILGGVMTPQYQFFLPCCAGTLIKNGKMMIVSRGIGTHSINIRIRNKPQIIKLNFENGI